MLHELSGWSPYQQQASAAWLIESPIAAIRFGGGGLLACALAMCGAVSDVAMTNTMNVTTRATVPNASCRVRPMYITSPFRGDATAT